MYKFKSKIAGDLIMLEPNGRQILEVICKANSPNKQGILLPEQMPAAIVALQAAIAQEEAEFQQLVLAAQAEHQAPPRRPGIGFKHRALPFIQLLERCQAAGEPVVWGI